MTGAIPVSSPVIGTQRDMTISDYGRINTRESLGPLTSCQLAPSGGGLLC